MQKLRVLYLIPSLQKGGAERFIVDLVNELNNRENIDVKLATLYELNEYRHDTEHIEVIQLNYKPFSFLKNNRNDTLKILLDEFNPHIIHSSLFQAELLSSYYLDRKRVYVCHGHDNMFQFRNFDLTTPLKKRLLFNFLEKMYLTWRKYKKVRTYFIANSLHTLSYYQKHVSFIPKENIRLIQYGFNFSRFNKGTNRKKIDSLSKLKLLNVGSFQEKKNQLFIVEIANVLRARGLDFEINLIGDGLNFNKVSTAIKDNNLEKYVFLHGILDNVEDWYNNSHLYLHTAWYEPFGLVFLEAMASGLPVITLDGKGNRDIIESGKNGFLFETQDANQFANCIINFTTSPQIYPVMSKYACEYAAGFEMKRKTDELIFFYREIASL